MEEEMVCVAVHVKLTRSKFTSHEFDERWISSCLKANKRWSVELPAISESVTAV